MSKAKKSAATTAAPQAGSPGMALTPSRRIGMSSAALSIVAAERALGEGHVEVAESLLRRVVAEHPASPAANRLLAIIALGGGRAGDAVRYATAGLQQAPSDPQAHLVLGRALKAAGELPQAIAAYRRAIAFAPVLAEAHVSLGIALKASGDLEAAIASYRHALELQPGLAVAQANLGSALALQAERRARPLDGDPASREALDCLDRAVAADPGNPELHRNHGALLMRAQRHEQAAHAFNRALTLDPSDAGACLSLAVCLSALGDARLARDAVQKWLGLNPANAALMRMLSEVLTRLGQIDEALDWAQQAHAIEPDPVTLLQMGNALLQARRPAEALARCRQALDEAGRPPELYPVYALGCNYLHEEPGPIEAVHAEFGARVAGLLRERPVRRRAPGERLRLGYVSGDLVRHSVPFFLEGLFAHHDRARFEVVAYHNCARSDAVTARLKAHTDGWVECFGSTDEQLRERIVADGIDILIDLSGHTAHSRLLVFATAAAPLQVGYLGYPTATGVPAMDYRLTDAVIDPHERFAGAAERPLRLQRTMFGYMPPDPAPRPAVPPSLRAGYVTFGSFNNVAKITDHTLELWCAVLRRVPGSRLLLKAAAAAQRSNRLALEQFLAARDIDPVRLVLQDTLADDQAHLALYASVDIALDTYPYNGATTTCEALWMGVPVVTRTGSTHTARMGASILGGIGRGDWIAASDEAFVDTAVRLAADRPGLARWRANARDTLRASTLLDVRGLTRDIEALLLQAWAEAPQQAPEAPVGGSGTREIV